MAVEPRPCKSLLGRRGGAKFVGCAMRLGPLSLGERSGERPREQDGSGLIAVQIQSLWHPPSLLPPGDVSRASSVWCTRLVYTPCSGTGPLLREARGGQDDARR